MRAVLIIIVIVLLIAGALGFLPLLGWAYIPVWGLVFEIAIGVLAAMLIWRLFVLFRRKAKTEPIITLAGDNSININYGDNYIEQGASWTDILKGSGNAVIGGDLVDTSKLGKYIVRYNYTDSSGNAAREVKRVVNVLDTQKPVITLLGDADLKVEAFSAYSDAGGTAYDNYDGDITRKIIVSGSVDTNVLGDYFIKFNVSDSSGNAADEVFRTIHIVDTTKPVITLMGENPVNTLVGDSYNDIGAIAIDDVDGDITNKIKIVNGVDIAKAGTYTVNYTASDSSGNEATAARTVNVMPHPPVAKDDGFAFTKNKNINIPIKTLLSNDSDPEGGKISFVSVSEGKGGKTTYLSLLKRIIFKPDKKFTGLASFFYTIQNSSGLQSNAAVWLSIGINELPNKLPPIVVNDTLSTNKVWTLIPIPGLLANDSDTEGGKIFFVSAGGTATNNARVISLGIFGRLLLLVKKGFNGNITFPYTIRDSAGLQSTGMVTVDVNSAHY